MFEVLIWEMDSWSGRDLSGKKSFDTKEEAILFVKEFNSKNNLTKAPDWYEYAEMK